MVEIGQWTWEVPTKSGWYWFCGTIWGHHVEMLPVRVRQGVAGPMYTGRGSFLSPKHNECHGVWQAAVIPRVPMYSTRRLF